MQKLNFINVCVFLNDYCSKIRQKIVPLENKILFKITVANIVTKKFQLNISWSGLSLDANWTAVTA